MQAIVTRFRPSFHGGTVVADCAAKRLSFPWDQGIGTFDNHMNAAAKLAEFMGWAGKWVAGGMPDETGYVFVNVERPHEGSFQVLDRAGEA